MRYLIIFLFFFAPTDLSLAGKVDKKTHNILYYYFQTLKSKGKNAKGAMAMSSEGYYNFEVRKNKSQNFVDNAVLETCNSRGTKCKIMWQGFNKNPNYRSVIYSRKSNTMEFQGKKFKVKYFYRYGKVKFFKSQQDVLFNNFACGKYKSSKHDKKIDSIIKHSVKAFPVKFLNKTGLNHVLLCSQTISGDIGVAGGLAPIDISGTAGIFLVSIDLQKTYKEADHQINQLAKLQEEFYQKCMEEKKRKKLKTKCSKKVYEGVFKIYGNPFLQTFAHELYHIIDYFYDYGFYDDEWISLNKNEYRKNVKINSQSMGFASAYGQTNMQEDKAVIFENMVVNREAFVKKIKEDKILFKKSKLLIKRLKNFYPNINQNFWKSFEKVNKLKDITWTLE